MLAIFEQPHPRPAFSVRFDNRNVHTISTTMVAVKSGKRIVSDRDTGTKHPHGCRGGAYSGKQMSCHAAGHRLHLRRRRRGSVLSSSMLQLAQVCSGQMKDSDFSRMRQARSFRSATRSSLGSTSSGRRSSATHGG